MIDSHHHFWKFTPEEFDWLEGELSSLRRDFLPRGLRETVAGTKIDGVISVQARCSLAETEWLLELAQNEKLIRGVVGWIPLKDPAVGDILDRFGKNPLFRGVREIIQGTADRDYLAHPDFDRGMRELTRRAIPYDLLVFHAQLPSAIEFVKRHPNQFFILDHIGKPEIRRDFATTWAKQIRELGKLENVACKFSGIVTEVHEKNWDTALLRPYFETVLAAFGANRLMFGSDWPVCLPRVDYKRWLETVEELIALLSSDERLQFMEGTAKKAYRL